jgi:predicted protein tyrosine phosphatase
MNFRRYYISGSKFTFDLRFSFENLWNKFMYKLTRLTTKKIMKTILALSKINFDKMMAYNAIDDSNVEDKDIMIVSICSPKDDNQPYISSLSKESYFKQEHPNVKIMYFGDYGEEESENNPHVFTKEQAKELYEFIKRNKNKKLILIHCGGGYNRSFSVGLFINDFIVKGSYEEYKKKNPQGIGNAYVYRLLKEQYYLDHHIPYS